MGNSPPSRLDLFFMMHIPEGANIDAKRKMLRTLNDAIVEAYHCRRS